MEKNQYMKESDLLLKKAHFPVYVFFNLISEKNFCSVCEDLSNGIGRGIEFAVCLFPDDMDIPSEKFDGIEFSLHSGEEVLLDYKTCYYYLKIACEYYLQNNPHDLCVINKVLINFCSRYKVLE